MTANLVTQLFKTEFLLIGLKLQLDKINTCSSWCATGLQSGFYFW